MEGGGVRFWQAARLGFEPRQREPKSLVLPLHHQAVGWTDRVQHTGPAASTDSGRTTSTTPPNGRLKGRLHRSGNSADSVKA